VARRPKPAPAAPVHIEEPHAAEAPVPAHEPEPAKVVSAPPQPVDAGYVKAPAPRPELRLIKRVPLDRNTLTNEGVVTLALAGYGEPFIAELIRSKPVKFDTTVEGLAFLAYQGISERLVRRILQVDADKRREEEEEWK
jgi:hypothetical protein